MKLQKLITLLILITNSTLVSAHTPDIQPKPPVEFDSIKCMAAKSVVKKMADMYMTDSKYCHSDSDCSTVDHVAGPICGGGIIVNKMGAAGHKLMTSSAEYKRLESIVRKNIYSCGPMPRCYPRPPGEVKCIKNKCLYDISDRY
jgi:hypothetical protein